MFLVFAKRIEASFFAKRTDLPAHVFVKRADWSSFLSAKRTDVASAGVSFRQTTVLSSPLGEA